MVLPIKILKSMDLLTGREAKAVLEEGIEQVLDDEVFFKLMEQTSWLPVYVKHYEFKVRALTKNRASGLVMVTGDFMLDDERMFDEDIMVGPPDIVVDMGRAGVFLRCLTIDCNQLLVAVPGGRSYMAKAFFKIEDVVRRVQEINGHERDQNDTYKAQPAASAARQGEKGMAQRRLILETLRELKYNPEALPLTPRGRCGPKKAVREKLRSCDLFAAPTSFNTAWKVLLANKKIKVIEE